MSKFAKSFLLTFSRRKISLGAMFSAIAIQSLLLFVAIFVVVMLPSQKEEPNFQAKHDVSLPHEDLNHQMDMDEFFQASSPVFQPERISLENVVPNIPPLPDIDMAHTDLSDMSHFFDSPEAADFFQLASLGSSVSLGSGGSNISLLGIKDNAQNIVIAFDVSGSVITNMANKNMPLPTMKDEVKSMIESLNANTAFTVVQFVRAYDFFSPQTIPATVANKKAAADWLEKHFSKAKGSSQTGWTKGSPNGIQLVSKAIFELQPDVIFIFSDGDFQRTPINKRSGNEQVSLSEWNAELMDYQRQLPKQARIHFIGFGVKENAKTALKNIFRMNGGQYKEF